jgi:hypothetical protein
MQTPAKGEKPPIDLADLPDQRMAEIIAATSASAGRNRSF